MGITRKSGSNSASLFFDLLQRELIGLSIDQERLVSGIRDLVEREEKLKGVVWFLAAEVDGASEIPSRIDERKFHEAIPPMDSTGSLPEGTGKAVGTKTKRLAWYH